RLKQAAGFHQRFVVPDFVCCQGLPVSFQAIGTNRRRVTPKMSYATVTTVNQVLRCQLAYENVVSRDRRATQIIHGAIDEDDLGAFSDHLSVRLALSGRKN